MADASLSITVDTVLLRAGFVRVLVKAFLCYVKCLLRARTGCQGDEQFDLPVAGFTRLVGFESLRCPLEMGWRVRRARHEQWRGH